MDKEILTPATHHTQDATLLYQNTPLLMELLTLSYEDYAKRDNLDTHAFIVGIREMVTQLIEPVCQQNPNGSERYSANLEQFNQYEQGDFRKYPDALKIIALAMTHLVQCAIESFRALKYPKAYNVFLNLFESIFKNDTIIQCNQHRNVLILIEQLRQKP